MTSIIGMHFIKIFKGIALTILGAMLFASCENDINIVKSLVIEDFEPLESSYNITTIFTDSGKVRMKMTSPEVNRYIRDKEYTEMPKGIYVEFFGTDGKLASMLKADYTISYDQSGIIEAKHNVVLMNLSGEKLYTEHLIWDQNKHIIFTEKPVKVVTFDKTLYGDGLMSDERFFDWTITHPRGDMYIKESFGD